MGLKTTRFGTITTMINVPMVLPVMPTMTVDDAVEIPRQWERERQQ
jgi:hypothetical protein